MSDTAPSFLLVQQESITFNQPTSEASTTSIAALANALRTIMLPVGSIVDSMLTEAQWHTQNNNDGTRWVISDGRNVAGSAYTALTGNSTVPDLRGIFRRGKGAANPDGDLALGTFTAAKFASHTHPLGFNDPGHSHTTQSRHQGSTTLTPSSFVLDSPLDFGGPLGAIHTTTVGTGIAISIGNTGTDDTAPANITVNSFIRIN